MSKYSPQFDDFFRRLDRRRRSYRWWRLLGRFLLVIGVLFSALWFLLQNERFQNYLVHRITTYLSAELRTQVALDRVDFDFFDQLVLEEFYIEDQIGDTLLYSKELRVEMSIDLISLLQRRVDVDNIYLSDAQINIKRKEGERKNNLEFLLAYWQNQDTTQQNQPPAQPLFLELDGIYLQNVLFYKDDRMKGNLLSVRIPTGEIAVEEINLAENFFRIEAAHFDFPKVVHDLFPPHWAPQVINTSDPGPVLTTPATPAVDSSQKLLRVEMGAFHLRDGAFDFNNYRQAPERLTRPEVMDFTRIKTEAIQIDLVDFVFYDDVFTTELEHLSLYETSGFVLDDLKAKEAIISNRRTILNDMRLITPYSELGDTLVFKYREYNDYNDFPNKVIMTGRFNQARVALKDIMVFAPALERNDFFVQNREELVEIDGLLMGKVSNLRGRDVQLRLGKNTYFKGNFDSRNLNVRNEEAMNLRIDRLITDVQTLRLLVPRFNPPANFDKLGQLNFSGRFDGFFVDFVAYGELLSDLGQARMDMRMDLRNGKTGARYAGGLSLENFDLGVWSGNPDLGMVTFKSEVKDGVGLTLETVDAKLESVIDRFSFRGYSYENVILDGRLNKEFFDGDLIVKDDNIDFNFSGSIRNFSTVPEFKFKAKVNHLDLQALKLSEQDIRASGEIDLDLRDIRLANIQGVASGRNIRVVRDGEREFSLDSIRVTSQLLPAQLRLFRVQSDILNGHLQGYFNIEKLPAILLHYLRDNFPQVFERLELQTPKPLLAEHQFEYQLSIPDTKNLTTLIDPGLDTLRGISASGYFNTSNDKLKIDLSIPEIIYNNLTLHDIVLQVEGEGGANDLNLEVYHTKFGKRNFEPVTLRGELHRDTFDFDIVAINWTTVLDNLHLAGELSLVDKYYQVVFSPSDLIIFKDRWDIAVDNYLRFGKGYVATRNFTLSNGRQSIELESLGDRGLRALVTNFDFSIIDEYWDYDRLDFRGPFDLEISAVDFYRQEGLDLVVQADTFEVNGDDWGALRLDAHANNLKSRVQAYLSITNGSQQLTGEGFYYPPKGKAMNRRRKTDQFDFNFGSSNYPLHIAEYFIINGLSNTLGYFNADVKLFGTFKRPNISGDLRVYDGALTVDYLNTRYYVHDQRARLTNFLFDVTGSVVTDSLGNTAELFGGITHDRLKNLGLDVKMRSDEFLVLNTTKENNAIYYGRGIVKGEVYFSGSFKKTDIDIDATTLPGSYLSIPISSAQEAEAVNFIKFVDKSEGVDNGPTRPSELLGVTVDMNLAITEDSEVSLIFDEKAGDVMQGQGVGNIDFDFDRSGNIEMLGNYTITEGKYLFTYNFLNKPFTVREGGTINWSGDPYNAELNLDAEYQGLNTAVYNFIAEYISDNDALKAAARQSTKVDLVMNLTGPLLQPVIGFDIQFPELTGDLQSYTESKLRAISQNQNELNRQVFGLFVLGGFLPTDLNALSSTTDNIVINTVTELISSQLSILTSDLLEEIVTDVDFISGIGLDIQYNVYDGEINNEGQILLGNQFGIRPEIGILDDRLTFRAGGGVNFGQAVGNGASLAGDIEVEYILTKDRRLKFRAYQLYDGSAGNVTGPRDQRGIGIRYRREGDTIKELFRRKSKEERDQLRRERTDAKAARRRERDLKRMSRQ